MDPSIPETFQAPPQPLPYNFDSQYARVVRDGLVSRRDKSGMSHLNVGEGEPLRHTNTSHDESAGIGTALQRRTLNCGGFDHDDQVFKPGSPEKRSSKAFPRVESTLSILDDEDICATCLDGIYRPLLLKLNVFPVFKFQSVLDVVPYYSFLWCQL